MRLLELEFDVGICPTMNGKTSYKLSFTTGNAVTNYGKLVKTKNVMRHASKTERCQKLRIDKG